jgi:hypothetical protein
MHVLLIITKCIFYPIAAYLLGRMLFKGAIDALKYELKKEQENGKKEKK